MEVDVNDEMRNLKEVQEELQKIASEISGTLNYVLDKFKPDPYIHEQLQPFMDEWGEKPFLQFVRFIQSDQCVNPPDVLNGEMSYTNIFWVVWHIITNSDVK